MADMERMLAAIRRMVLQGIEDDHPTDLVTGVVVDDDPVRIRIDSGLVLDGDFLAVGALCRKLVVNVGGEDVTVWPGLQTDDTVLMIQSRGMDLYYVQEVIS